MEVFVYIGFGSNLGNVLENWQSAQQQIEALANIISVKSSVLYQTEPLTLKQEIQPWYLNCVFEVKTSMALDTLHAALQKIELAMGKDTTRKWAPRVVDLDILFYGNVIYKDDKLKVPHPEIPNRLFVLQPLCDLNPQLVHPELHMTVAELIHNTTDTLKIMPLNHPHNHTRKIACS